VQGNKVLKVKVTAGGDITADGQPVTLEQLAAKLADLKQAGGEVWYHRENPAREPYPNALKVIELVANNGLPAMQPRSLKIAGREVFVDTTPLETQVAGFQAKSLHRAGRQRLVLKPSLGIRLFALLWILAGVMLVYVLVTDRGKTGKQPLGPYWGALCASLCASPFLVGGLLLLVLPCRVEFDRDAGCMRTCRLGSRRELPLREVLAIQPTKGYWRTRFGPGCQLNVVLDDDRQRRMCLSEHIDWKHVRVDWKVLRVTAADLAEFLGVALLDEVSGDKSEAV
jgi:hypothetical protein